MPTAQNDSLDDLAITNLARRALDQYPAAFQGDLKLLCRSENATFVVTAGGKRHALRLHRDNYHTKAEIECELLWLDALRRDLGIEVPEAIPARNGERVLTVSAGSGSERHAALFHWIEGEEPNNSVDPTSFQRLGEITGRLHQHSRSWKPTAGFKRILWSHETMTGAGGHWGDWAAMPGLSPADRQLILEVLQQVNEAMLAYGSAVERFGLIHADLRLTNLLLHGGETRIIDFDDCGIGWYLHDLAAAVSFEESHPNAPKWIEHWLAGYERVAHMDEADFAALPSMLIQRRVQLTAWMASHSATETAKLLSSEWVSDTLRLSRRYLEGDVLPIGA